MSDFAQTIVSGIFTAPSGLADLLTEVGTLEVEGEEGGVYAALFSLGEELEGRGVDVSLLNEKLQNGSLKLSEVAAVLRRIPTEKYAQAALAARAKMGSLFEDPRQAKERLSRKLRNGQSPRVELGQALAIQPSAGAVAGPSHGPQRTAGIAGLFGLRRLHSPSLNTPAEREAYLTKENAGLPVVIFNRGDDLIQKILQVSDPATASAKYVVVKLLDGNTEIRLGNISGHHYYMVLKGEQVVGAGLMTYLEDQDEVYINGGSATFPTFLDFVRRTDQIPPSVSSASTAGLHQVIALLKGYLDGQYEFEQHHSPDEGSFFVLSRRPLLR